MSQPNPYEAPLTGPQMGLPQVAGIPQGIWRQGSALVMHRTAQLPDICVKTNEPATTRLRTKFQWHHPAVFLAIIPGLLFYIILALVLTKRADVEIPISEQTRQKRKTGILIAVFVGLAGLGAIIVGFFMLANDMGFGGLFLLVGFVGGLVGLVVGSTLARLLRPTKIDDQYLWLSGASAAYLERLPPWPYH